MEPEVDAHDDSHDDLAETAETVADRLAGRSVAVAESCTAGVVAQALASAPEASSWFRGGVVAYHSETKWRVLGVDEGPVVTERAAEQMARGVAELLDADVAVATTGVAGPGEQEGKRPGTVMVGWWRAGGGSGAATLELSGEPEEVIRSAAVAALGRLAELLADPAR